MLDVALPDGGSESARKHTAAYILRSATLQRSVYPLVLGILGPLKGHH
jgi:hypothetical protein